MESVENVRMTGDGIEFKVSDNVAISRLEYTKLIKIAERVSILERIIERNEYIPVEEIRAIFDIKPVCKPVLGKAREERP